MSASCFRFGVVYCTPVAYLFLFTEIEIGKVLGEGEFGVVCEVKEFFVSDECHCSVCISDRKKSAPDSPPVKKLVVSGMPLHAHKTRKESGSRVSFADVPITIDDIENLREADEQDEKIPLFVEQELEYSSDFEQREERGFMKAHCYRNGLARYAGEPKRPQESWV